MNKELLTIKTENISMIGGTQFWFEKKWQRMSGCGATVASNMMWYIQKSRFNGICDEGKSEKADFFALMTEMFCFITPGFGGVNKSGIFTKGALEYAAKHGVKLESHVLEIHKQKPLRPTHESISEFFFSANAADCPIAFLNLSNGAVKNLDSWHWVTITDTSHYSPIIEIADQGEILKIDFDIWVETSKRGGALVWFSIKA
ncbi:MAG TPA: hypothetical protein PKH29_10915 [Oscillospiraceae bacterium]|nr:hypothetical protein [Oscillospiraceae bacterium]